MWNRFGDGYRMMGGNWFGALLMMVLWVAVVAAIVLLIVRMIRHDGSGHGPMMMRGMHHDGPGMTPPPAGHDEAVTIARKRYASGEITKEQLEEILKTLG